MKRSSRIFTQLEKFNRSKYPKFLKQILIETAFNIPASLKAINEQSIESIEKFVNNDLKLLNKTEYVNEKGELKVKPFKFLIGHKALILNFPKEIDVLKAAKKREKSQNRESTDENASENELTNLLILKITNYCKTKKIKIPNTVNLSGNISNFEQNLDQTRVSVKCPFCIKIIPCTVDTVWRMSNFGQHITTCSLKTVSRPQIQRATPQILSVVSQNIG